MADALNPNYTDDTDLYNNDNNVYDDDDNDDDDDTLKNGQPLSADTYMSVFEPFMLDSDDDEDSHKKSNSNSKSNSDSLDSDSNPLDQYDMDLSSQNMEMDPSEIGEVVAENPELLMAL